MRNFSKTIQVSGIEKKKNFKLVESFVTMYKGPLTSGLASFLSNFLNFVLKKSSKWTFDQDRLKYHENI